MSAPVRHLYVHIPFCPKVCPYCSFYVERTARGRTQPLVEALLREAERVAGRLELGLETVFLGGGTPTALSEGQLAELVEGLGERLDFSGVREFSVEMNPSTVSPAKARRLRGLGVTRASLGVQSWDADVLRVLGRTHGPEEARRTFDVLREAGFPSVSVDLMFAVPGQTAAVWRESLETTVGLGPDHVSAYNLTYEEDTEFFRRLQAGELREDADDGADFFVLAEELLTGAGFGRYEISNYARPGHESAHNSAYWAGADYVGLGPSAFSTVGDRRWRNVADTGRYTGLLLGGEAPAEGDLVDFTEALDYETRRRERVALSLRTRRGLPLVWLEGRGEVVRDLVAEGLLELDGECCRLTARGRLLADGVAEALL